MLIQGNYLLDWMAFKKGSRFGVSLLFCWLGLGNRNGFDQIHFPISREERIHMFLLLKPGRFLRMRYMGYLRVHVLVSYASVDVTVTTPGVLPPTQSSLNFQRHSHSHCLSPNPNGIEMRFLVYKL